MNEVELLVRVSVLEAAAKALLAALPKVPMCDGASMYMDHVCHEQGTHRVSLDKYLRCHACALKSLQVHAKLQERAWERHVENKRSGQRLEDPTAKIAAWRAEVPRPDPVIEAQLALMALVADREP